MKSPQRSRGRWIDRIMESGVYLSGGITLVIIFAIFGYLSHESKYAFQREFDYGFRFAAQPPEGSSAPVERDVAFDPNATYLTANREGAEGLDEKEETAPAPTLDSLAGFGVTGTAATLVSTPAEIDPANLYRDDWRDQKKTSEAARFVFAAFATPELKESTMLLAWKADEQPFDVAKSPFKFRLRLIQAPPGVTVSVDEDLSKRPSGQVELPAYIARTDEDRTKGYLFELTAESSVPNGLAIVQGTLDTSWNPTGAYPRYGFIPLFFGSFFITVIAMLIATPIAIAAGIFLSEMAPARVREWVKPIIEVLASVPTVVLGYFGLLLVAPAVLSTFRTSLGIDNGRTLFTAAIVLAVLLLPVITSFAEDALRNVPSSLRDGADALGLTARERLKKVVLPAARSGLIAAALLGFARAVGETMILWILSGASDTMPSIQGIMKYLVSGVRGTPDTIATDMGNVSFEGVHYGHLFLLGLVLFSVTLVINLIGFRLSRRATWRN